jgi:uncharacterized membrane protein
MFTVYWMLRSYLFDIIIIYIFIKLCFLSGSIIIFSLCMFWHEMIYYNGVLLRVGAEKNNPTVPLRVIRGDKKGNPVPEGITGPPCLQGT